MVDINALLQKIDENSGQKSPLLPISTFNLYIYKNIFRGRGRLRTGKDNETK